MADPAQTPQPIDRPRYRRRRLEDAAWILPALGVALFLLPLLWSAEEGVLLGAMLIYLFGAWFVLIVLTFLLSRLLSTPVVSGRDDDL